MKLTVRDEGARIARHVATGEVEEDPLPLLRLTGEGELGHKVAQRRVDCLVGEVEETGKLLAHQLGEVVSRIRER